MSRRKLFLSALAIVAIGGGILWVLDAMSVFGPSYVQRPALDKTPPLKPSTRTSTIAVPVTVALAAIRTRLDAAAPRNFTGKRPNPIAGPFIKSEIGWAIRREALALAGRPEGLALTAPLSGTLAVGDSLTSSASTDPISGMLDFISGAFDQRGEVRGKITLTARPTLLPNWRIDPNLTGQVSIPEGGLSVGGIPIDVSGDVKSAIDQAVSDQVKVLQTQVRNDSTIEEVARWEWARMCRSISLAAIAAGNPDLYLEMRPIRAFAAHPRIEPTTATVTLGIEAQLRIAPSATAPNCPFPAQLDIVPPAEQGNFTVVAPIEVAFTEINQILGRQLNGRTFPESGDSLAQVTIRRARVQPSGDRLLISLVVKAREQTTWFGFNGWATMYIWVRPRLDREQQKLMLTDMEVDVRSRAGFGLFGAAARAALPYIQDELEKYAVIDLKPYAASARTGVEAAVAEFDKQDDGVNAGATITDLRLVDVEFDSTTLRVTAEVEGAAKIAVTELPK
jgi:hypothetical protein